MTRNWKWFVPVTGVAGVLMLAAFIYTIFSLGTGMMKSSVPYQQALARAKASPEVQTALGIPIKDGFMASGKITTSGPTGSASLEIPISGPKGKADIYLEARKSSGVWSFSTLNVTVAGQPETIELPH
jgi:Cytochrome oxidase complex assembly protein 1